MNNHQKVAKDCWQLIKALAATDDFNLIGVLKLEDLDGAALRLIEMACDSAAEAQTYKKEIEPLFYLTYHEAAALYAELERQYINHENDIAVRVVKNLGKFVERFKNGR